MDAHQTTASQRLAVDIAHSLLRATESGDLSWTATGPDDWSVDLDAGRASIAGHDDDHPYMLRLTGRADETLSELVSQPADTWDDTRPAAPWNTVLRRLHHAAADSDRSHVDTLERLRAQAAALVDSGQSDHDARAEWAFDDRPDDMRASSNGLTARRDDDVDYDDEPMTGGASWSRSGDAEGASTHGPAGESRRTSSAPRPFGEAKRPLMADTYTRTASTQHDHVAGGSDLAS